MNIKLNFWLENPGDNPGVNSIPTLITRAKK